MYRSGFTLIEMMVVVALTGILAALAIPNLTPFITRNEITSIVNNLSSAVLLARSEAIKRGTTVSICRANSAGTNCDTANQIWDNGWLVYSNPLFSNSVNTTSGDIRNQLIRAFPKVTPGYYVTQLPGTLARLSWSGSGEQAGGLGAASFTVGRSNISPAVDYETFVCLSSAGRARIIRPNQGNC
jgi:type IV fimbrial biogenesis protein FimT